MSKLSAIILLGAGVVTSALPLGLPAGATFVPPLLMAALIYIFSSMRPPLPGWIAFTVGLASDVLSAGPLGYWAFVFLLVHTAATVWPAKPQWGLSGIWGRFGVTVAAVSLAGWVIACLYFFNTVDWQPMANGAIFATLLFPLLAWPFRTQLGLTRAAAAVR